jgi:hypothetical protein
MLSLFQFVEKLSLHECNLRGTIPEGLFEKVTRLTEITLFKNAFSGIIPSTVGRLKDAQVFLVGDNKFSGTLPHQIGLMIDLQEFQISGNNIGGSIPEIINGLKDLREFKVGKNSLTGKCLS